MMHQFISEDEGVSCLTCGSYYGPERYDAGVQGLGVTRVQQADRGIGVGGERAAGHVREGRHTY